ncbi:MAG TPA: AEC family transporter [Pontiellaceae bacterium]|nr:AEC family transporter [Pontiellaceae bacterium]HPR82235.1 AEC family transporter [Pontiellaceae bacterium]
MNLARMLDVLVICVPVFAVLGLGKLLQRNGRLDDGHCNFINWLVYYFSLPALIFTTVARQRFEGFLDPALILMPLLALILVIAVTMLIAKLSRFKGGFAAAFVFGTFWANATYLGLPLCTNAFGAEGLAKAAVYNACVVPFFIIFGYSLLGFYGAGSGDLKIGSRIRTALLNPVLLAAVAGILVALSAGLFRSADGALNLPVPVLSAATLLGSFFQLVGSMGLPLGLLSIGASLRWEQARGHLVALSWTVGCKLILLPLLTLLLIRRFCPSADAVSLGSAVILSATPGAVACYIISCKFGIEKSFAAALLVVGTALSVLTIPCWVYLLKSF